MSRAATLVCLSLAVSAGCTPAPRTAAPPQAAALSQTATSSPAAAQRQTPADTSIASWAATAAMVADAWLDRTVPRAYALRTLETAAKRVRAQAKANGVERRATAIEHLRTAIQRENDGDVHRALAELSS